MEDFNEIVKKIIFNEKKVLKSTVKKVDLTNILSTYLGTTDTASLFKNRALLGVVKIYVKKFRYLLDEGNELLLKVNHRESIRVVKNKNINLKLDKRDFYVTDDLLKDKEEPLCHEQWPDFDNVSIEAMRDESGALESTLIEGLVDQVEQPKKKRKIVEDEITEFDANFYKKNICDSKNTIVNNLEIDLFQKENFKIDSIFFKNLELPRVEQFDDVEQMRNETVFDNIDHFDIPFDNTSGEESGYSGVLDVNEDFVFNLKVLDLQKIDKAKEFLRLLELAGEGKVKCIQESPFAPILCKRN